MGRWAESTGHRLVAKEDITPQISTSEEVEKIMCLIFVLKMPSWVLRFLFSLQYASPKLSSTLDLLPTIFNLVGAKVPQDRIIDGVDMAPILFKKGAKVLYSSNVHNRLSIVYYSML